MSARPSSFHHLGIMLVLVISAALLATSASRGSIGPGHHSVHRSAAAPHRTPAKRATTYTGPRDQSGRIVRSEAAKERFMRQTGYPHGRPGYVVDHIIPLANGGAGGPSNMQW